MQAVILAAGLGKRLYPLTKDLPKSLVEVDGESILVRALENLFQVGVVSEIILVVGHKKEIIKKKIGLDYKGIPINYIENRDYMKTNNIYSLWLTRDFLKEDFFLIEGDILFEGDILKELVEKKEDRIVISKYNESWMDGTAVTLDEETTFVSGMIPKSLQTSSLDYSKLYKTANIYYITQDFYSTYFKPSLEFHMNNALGSNNYYELILGILFYSGVRIKGEVINENKWFEVDNLNDLELAEQKFGDKGDFEKIFKMYGGYWRFDFLDFCYLYNHYFPPNQLYSKISNILPKLIRNYPSSQERIAKIISRWYGSEEFNPENIIVGNGSSEIIRIINKNLVERVAIPVPTFAEYENQLTPEQIKYFPLDESNDFKIDFEEYSKFLEENRCNFALIINPNNPTGCVEKKEDIERLVRTHPNVNFIVDESFLDFTEDKTRHTVRDLIMNYNNLLLVRSISKELGVAGLRIGYLLTTNTEIKSKVNEFLPIWNVNSIAESFLELFLKYEKEYCTSLKNTIRDREYLVSKLKKLSYLKVFPSESNFVLCKLMEGDSRDLVRKVFSRKNILIKDCSTKAGLEEGKYIRVSVRPPEEVNKLIRSIQEVKEGEVL